VALDIALRLFPKGVGDCRDHHWYVTLSGEVERCRYCNYAVRAVAPETADPWRAGVDLAMQKTADDEEFGLLVHRVWFAAGLKDQHSYSAEALLLAAWLHHEGLFAER
jgi:hypothetical protein